ncbi:hypothetical protein T08_14948 [Trichinella sp. T8]|nr:hypothetical protein T08_14948 [Trichinella sp. T8]
MQLCREGMVLLDPTFLLLVFAHAILLDRRIFPVLVFILLGPLVFDVLFLIKRFGTSRSRFSRIGLCPRYFIGP